jgi:hypothetical protein
LISIAELTTPNSKDTTKNDPIWPDTAFQQFLEIASSPAAEVAGTQNRIGLPAAAQSRSAWFIAGVRIDAGAPGLSPDIKGQFGQSPEIRLILQLVTKDETGAPMVNDIAAHLIFDFIAPEQDGAAQPGCSQRPRSDDAQLKAIVVDLAALRSKLSSGQLGPSKIVTSNFPLGVYPGLLDPTTASNVRSEMKSFLLKHLSGARLDAMAIMGIPASAPEPWIFLSMVKVPPGVVPTRPDGGFIPVHGPVLDGVQFAQSFAPPGTIPPVVPQPLTNNLNPITCKNAALPPPGNLPGSARSGVSTSQLFISPPPAAATAKSILDVIADPTKSHFFNTDCVSCHTETRRARRLLQINSVPGIDPAVLPQTDWTLRNFGWSPPIEGPVQPVATRRTGAETDAVVAFINSQVLNH